MAAPSTGRFASTGTLAAAAMVAAAALSTRLAGCAAAAETVEGASGSIVYGADDRQEYFDLEGTAAGATLAQSVVAFVEAGTLTPGAADPTAGIPSYEDRWNLCAGEPFAEQPAAAFCSGVLVDWDLVLTAGHCLRLLPLEEISVVFGYYYESPGQLGLGRSDLFSAVEIVAEALDPVGSEPRLDYAWVRLDRPVGAPRRPARVHTARPPVAEGESVVSIGAGAGVPIKIDAGGRVRAPREGFDDYFVADTDTSHGSSGGGGFDQQLALLGVLSRGGTDLAPSPERGCNIVVRAPADFPAEEQFTYAHRAVEDLCALDPGLSSLCRAECQGPCEALPPAERPEPGGCAIAAPASRDPIASFPIALGAAAAAAALVRAPNTAASARRTRRRLPGGRGHDVGGDRLPSR